MVNTLVDPKLAIAVILVATMVLFIWGRWRHDVVAILALLASVLLGVVPPENAFTGLADTAVITVALVLILSAAVRQSGVLDRALRFVGPALDVAQIQIVVLVAIVTVLSAFMNNVGALAIVMPLAIAASERAGRSPSLVLMPLAFGSLLGGLITLIGTPPNLLISSVRQELTGEPFGMFDFAPVGLAIASVGVAYLAFAWRLLPADRRGAPSPEQRFQIADFVTEARVVASSSVAGKTIAEVEGLSDGEVTVLALATNGRTFQNPSRYWRLSEGDVLVLEGDTQALRKLVGAAQLELVGDGELSKEYLTSKEIGTLEVVVGASSSLIGQSSSSMRLRDLGVNLLAMSRQGGRLSQSLSRARFREGDVLALHGDLDHLAFTIKEFGLLPLAERQIELGRRSNLYVPALVMASCVALATAGILSIAIAFLAGVMVLALLRVMRPNEMYSAIDAPVLILMAALIPVTQAVSATGATSDISNFISATAEGLQPIYLLLIVLISTILVTPVLNNAATVLLMGPIAAGLAKSSGLNPDAMLMAVAVGASCDFLTPFGHQSNTLVMGPGGYRFLDYSRMGAPLTIIVVVVSLVIIPLVWPLTR